MPRARFRQELAQIPPLTLATIYLRESLMHALAYRVDALSLDDRVEQLVVDQSFESRLEHVVDRGDHAIV